MKYEKEATTKNGRRTWKVTYELVHGPEPTQRRKAEKTATSAPKAAPKSEAKEGSSSKKRPPKPAAKATKRKKRPAVKDEGQLGFF